MSTLFWLFLICTGYSYFIYPLILILISNIKKDELVKYQENKDLPFLSLIITVHNEEKVITKKLENSLAINYPTDKREIIVASDQPTDSTDEIVKGMRDKGIILVPSGARNGKEYAQLQGIRRTRGEILVFSDAATEIPSDAFLLIADIFRNLKIGAVSSEDQFVSNDGKIVGEGLYIRYEMWLRKLESRVAGLVGLSGSFFCARKEVCENWDIMAPSDFNTALNSVIRGYIAITDNRLKGIYKDVHDPSIEYARKVRTVIRGITSVSRKLEVLNPFKFGIFSFQVWSHKIMRWLVPWFMLFTLLLSFLIYDLSIIYKVIVFSECIFFGLVLIGHVSITLREFIIVKIPYYFMLSNIAIANATISFIFGKRVTVWQPTKR